MKYPSENSCTGVKLFLVSKFQCILFLKFLFHVGEGEMGGNANFKINHPEPLTLEITATV